MINNTASDRRARRMLPQLVKKFELDLSGLVVYTEAATGPYLYTPLLAAAAGASVIAYTRDSNYGRAEDVARATIKAADELRLGHAMRVVLEKTAADLSTADIITNSGFVRPIDEVMVQAMKPTSVVPLMWEPWEFRAADLDLDACRHKGILVMGTNEQAPPCDMTGYTGLVALKLLFALGLEVYGSSVLLLGGQASLGGAICRCLRALGAHVRWFGGRDSLAEDNYDELAQEFMKTGAAYDAILVAEHVDTRLLIGTHGMISYASLLAVNPSICIGIISGNIDRADLHISSLSYYPKNLQPAGYMSYQAAELGPRPVLELYAAGIKVGEAMARARRAGKTAREAIEFAKRHSPALEL